MQSTRQTANITTKHSSTGCHKATKGTHQTRLIENSRSHHAPYVGTTDRHARIIMYARIMKSPRKFIANLSDRVSLVVAVHHTIVSWNV